MLSKLNNRYTLSYWLHYIFQFYIKVYRSFTEHEEELKI
jgi:hypothetical protein